ncbi:hypothetical protein BG015_011138 [Linnemannia schmuckeri]|uniref:Uncharacterized protein n=1 Tax=Linnemannia schmuckeri TaxID=64567 RepID=A0A9P5RTJ7_9FUNG|nr:hypothetical protein BG015_011138 [Linnemannia schmuckeri]
MNLRAMMKERALNGDREAMEYVEYSHELARHGCWPVDLGQDFDLDASYYHHHRLVFDARDNGGDYCANTDVATASGMHEMNDLPMDVDGCETNEWMQRESTAPISPLSRNAAVSANPLTTSTTTPLSTSTATTTVTSTPSTTGTQQKMQQILNRNDKIAFLTKYTDRMHLKLQALGIEDWGQGDIQRKKTYQLMIQHNDKTGEKDLVKFYLGRYGGSVTTASDSDVGAGAGMQGVQEPMGPLGLPLSLSVQQRQQQGQEQQGTPVVVQA